MNEVLGPSTPPRATTPIHAITTESLPRPDTKEKGPEIAPDEVDSVNGSLTHAPVETLTQSIIPESLSRPNTTEKGPVIAPDEVDSVTGSSTHSPIETPTQQITPDSFPQPDTKGKGPEIAPDEVDTISSPSTPASIDSLTQPVTPESVPRPIKGQVPEIASDNVEVVITPSTQALIETFKQAILSEALQQADTKRKVPDMDTESKRNSQNTNSGVARISQGKSQIWFYIQNERMHYQQRINYSQLQECTTLEVFSKISELTNCRDKHIRSLNFRYAYRDEDVLESDDENTLWEEIKSNVEKNARFARTDDPFLREIEVLVDVDYEVA